MGQLRVVKRALHAGVTRLCFSKAAALSATVGPSEHAGQATRTTDVAKVPARGALLTTQNGHATRGVGAAQVRQGEGELGDPVLVTLSFGNVGIELSILAVTTHAQNLVIRGDARRHAVHDFAARMRVR